MTSIYTGDARISSSSEALSTQLSSSLLLSPFGHVGQGTRFVCENIGNLTSMSSIQSFPTTIFLTSTSRRPTFTGCALTSPSDVISCQRQQALAVRNSKGVLDLAKRSSSWRIISFLLSKCESFAEELAAIITNPEKIKIKNSNITWLEKGKPGSNALCISKMARRMLKDSLGIYL
jgi:hypothetical protein